jgi:hypothetical protein
LVAAFRLLKPNELVILPRFETAYGTNSSPPNNDIGSGTRTTEAVLAANSASTEEGQVEEDLPPVPPAGRIDERPAGTGGRRTSPTSNPTRPKPGTVMLRLAKSPRQYRGEHEKAGL